MLRKQTASFAVIILVFFVSTCFAKNSRIDSKAQHKRVVTSLDTLYQQKLSKLIKSNNTAGLETFIYAQKNPYQARTAALVFASYHGNEKMVKSLVPYAVDVNEALKLSPLVAAVAGKRYSVIKYLLSKGADINNRGSVALPARGGGPILIAGSGGFALRTAVLLDDAKMIQYLLKNGAKVDPDRHSNMFLFAAQIGSLPAIKAFLNYGVDINMQDSEGHTALIRASVYGAVESVDLLVTKNPDMNISTKERSPRTALMAAAWNDHAGVITSLISNGVDINYNDNGGEPTALLIAAGVGNYSAVKALVEGGADKTFKSGESTALDLAKASLKMRKRNARSSAQRPNAKFHLKKLNNTKKIIKLLSGQSPAKVSKPSSPPVKKAVTTTPEKKKQAKKKQKSTKSPPVADKKEAKVVGCWKWSNGVYIILNKDGSAKNGNVNANWKVKDAATESYTIIWPPILDTLTLSKDGKSLSGTNSFGLPVSAIRISGNIQSVAGQWQWVNGLKVVLAANKSVVAGPFKGSWSKKGAKYVIAWPVIDSVEVSSNKNELKGSNQFGPFTAMRDKSCKKR